jgi:uncharacterized protein (DUF362 family)
MGNAWSRRSFLAQAAQAASSAPLSKLAMPGPYRGRVVAVEHSGSIDGGKYQAEPVRAMMRRGMSELTDGEWVEAWRQFVSPGDVVGIKVNPVGAPHVISAPEVLREIIAGLEAAGIKRGDIVVYDRYRYEFYKAGFHRWLPEGVRVSNAARQYDVVQQAIESYDPDHYMEMALTLPGHDISSVTARRSYLAKFITKEVNKLINLCVLKDHQSAGVTLALKNLSHGLVNNVSRSHGSKTSNACGTFIPAVVSLPMIRNKAVLHILDGVKGQYHGGPGGKPQFVWEHKTIYFATDPVALDHVGYRVIDEQRVSVGMKRIVEDTPDEYSTFVHRQPEHIELAGAMGLGEFEWEKIQVKRIKLA